MRTTMMILAAMVFVSCGQQQANEEASSVEMAPAAQKQTSIQPMVETPVQQGMFRFNSVKEMPVCDESRVGMIAYAKETNEFFSCEDGEWFEIDLSGDDGSDGIDGVGQQGMQGVQGQQGQQGIQGIQGQAGTNGIDNHIVTRWECATTIDDNVAYFASSIFHHEYELNVLSSGDVFVRFRWMMGTSGEWETTQMYPAAHTKASNGSISVMLNFAGGSSNGGLLNTTINKATDVATFTYTDADMINLGGVYTKSFNCTKTSY